METATIATPAMRNFVLSSLELAELGGEVVPFAHSFWMEGHGWNQHAINATRYTAANAELEAERLTAGTTRNVKIVPIQQLIAEGTTYLETYREVFAAHADRRVARETATIAVRIKHGEEAALRFV